MNQTILNAINQDPSGGFKEVKEKFQVRILTDQLNELKFKGQHDLLNLEK